MKLTPNRREALIVASLYCVGLFLLACVLTLILTVFHFSS